MGSCGNKVVEVVRAGGAELPGQLSAYIGIPCNEAAYIRYAICNRYPHVRGFLGSFGLGSFSHDMQ